MSHNHNHKHNNSCGCGNPNCNCGSMNKKYNHKHHNQQDEDIVDLLAGVLIGLICPVEDEDIDSDTEVVESKSMLDKDIEKLLNENEEKELTLDELSEMVNSSIKSTNDKLANGKQILVDSPVKVKKATDDIVIENAVDAMSLKKKQEKKVRLINVNKVASKILTKIFNNIHNSNNRGDNMVYFSDEDTEDEFTNVKWRTQVKVIDKVSQYLKEKGFNVFQLWFDDEEEVKQGEETKLLEYELKVKW